MSEKRIAIVKQAFQILDEEGKGYVDYKALIGRYHAELHPRVKIREKTPEVVKKEFENTLGDHV